MVAEDFVKSAAAEKHPTTRNTHYYERQVTEEDSEVPKAPPFHVQPLKAAKAGRTPPLLILYTCRRTQWDQSQPMCKQCGVSLGH